ncbi:MAG: hypothetical protein Q4G04_06430 [bacterium]|nr:hypothetical protein [bacterium]
MESKKNNIIIVILVIIIACLVGYIIGYNLYKNNTTNNNNNETTTNNNTPIEDNINTNNLENTTKPIIDTGYLYYLYERAYTVLNTPWIYNPNNYQGPITFSRDSENNIITGSINNQNMPQIANYDYAIKGVFTEDYINCNILNNQNYSCPDNHAIRFIYKQGDNYYMSVAGKGYYGKYKYTNLIEKSYTENSITYDANAVYYAETCHENNAPTYVESCTETETKTTTFTIVKENGIWKVSEITAPY